MKKIGASKQQKLLVVGKEPAVLISLRTILNIGRLHVLTTDEPEAAVRLTEDPEAEIGLALIDVCTVEVEPRILAARLRKVRPEIKILFFSSLVDGKVIRLGIIDPDGGVLRKEGVVRAVEDALREPASTPKPERKKRLKTMTAGRLFPYPAM